MTTLYQRIRELLARTTILAVERGVLPEAVAAQDIPLERPRQASLGDLATNLCFSLSKAARQNPRALAEQFVRLLPEVDADGWIAAAEVAGPGFLNLRLHDRAWQAAVTDALQGGADYGRNSAGGQEKVLLEFVSANPTGPMHVGHGRGAVLGDALARIMRFADYQVTTEYYVNNVGNQIGKLGESVWHWLRAPELRKAALALWGRGEPVPFPEGFPEGFPEDGYRGAYIAETAETLASQGLKADPKLIDWSHDPSWGQSEPGNPSGRPDNREISILAWQMQLERIRADLDLLDIHFDRWFSERSLHGLDPGSTDAVAAVVQRLLSHDWAFLGESNLVEAEDGAPDVTLAEGPDRPVQFRGTSEDIPKPFRDSKDRVILRSDGRPTYFAADIAYHDDKLARGFDHLVNILGADHHGYISRLKGVIHALGDLRRAEGDANGARWSGDRLEVLLIQMVALLREGKPVPMGKRSGEFVTLRDVIDEVTTGEASPSTNHSGRDAVRFIFLTRKADAQLDFDLDVARRTSMDNPVYYVQYGHARLASILQRAESEGKGLRQPHRLAGLTLPDERELALTIAELPEVIARCARSREPHQLAFWLMDTCRAFHAYYTKGKVDARVISDDEATTQARLALIAALKQAIGNGLHLLGVTAPDRMATLPQAEDAEKAGEPLSA